MRDNEDNEILQVFFIVEQVFIDSSRTIKKRRFLERNPIAGLRPVIVDATLYTVIFSKSSICPSKQPGQSQKAHFVTATAKGLHTLLP